MSIPYGKQYIDEKDIQEVVATLKSNYLTTWPKVAEFEQKLCAYTWSKYAVAVGNGTQALHIAYQTIWLQAGDEIITTANTFVATSNAALFCWATPVFCDIELENYNIDANKIENLITAKTKAIVPVHFAGQPCEMTKIWDIAKKYWLQVIEDWAHALGAQYNWIKIGNTQSDMVTLSFHPVKPITTGEWGAVLTNNKEYYEKLLKLRSHGIERDEKWFNNMVYLWNNYRITDIQCALWCSQMDKLDYFLESRKNIVKKYNENLHNTKWIILPKEKDNTICGWHLYVVRFETEEIRDNVMSELKQKWYWVTLHYPPVYSHTYYREHGYKDTTLPNAELYYKTCLSLPIFVGLEDKDIDAVCFIIKDMAWRK
jgi:dTDP-4-amino-4,6-dideoxygalactose transaminase